MLLSLNILKGSFVYFCLELLARNVYPHLHKFSDYAMLKTEFDLKASKSKWHP